jgi:hypothetical protein
VLTTAALRTAILALAALLTVPAAGSAGTPISVPVALTADASSPETGYVVTVTARVRHLPRSGLIVIRVTDPDGSLSTVATCTKPVCSGTWTEADDGTAGFQAFVRTKPHAGRIVGRTSVMQVTWHVPPEPAPPPGALTGHYCGLSNEGKSVCFDLTGGDQKLQRVANLRIESNVSCGDGSSWWWWLYPPGDLTIDQTTLSFSYSGTWTVNPTTATNAVASYTIIGTFDTAGNVTGTTRLTHMSWDQNGKHYDCAGDPRTWTARLGA